MTSASSSTSAAPNLHYRLCDYDYVHTEYDDLRLEALSFPGEFSDDHEISGWQLRKRGGLLNRNRAQPLVVPMLVAEIDYYSAIAPLFPPDTDFFVSLISKYLGRFPMISTSLFSQAVHDIQTHTCHTFRPHSGSIPNSIPSIAIRALLKKEPGKYVVPMLVDGLGDENRSFHLFWGRYPFPGDASPRDAAIPSRFADVSAPLALRTDGYDTDEEDQNTSKTPLPDPTTSSISALVVPTDPLCNYKPDPENMFHFHLSFDFIEPQENETLTQAAERELPVKQAAMHQFLTQFAATRTSALPAAPSSSKKRKNDDAPASTSSTASSSSAASDSSKKPKHNPATAVSTSPIDPSLTPIPLLRGSAVKIIGVVTDLQKKLV